MAQQPADITAILAALAQQNGSSATPSQARPPHLQSPYPGNGAATPSGGYQLPPPPQVGSIDLSQIQPTSTGNVSLNDAIAKASALAKSRDMRESERPYSQSRNRSRSPQRPRDGYNPYRDERRDDARRGANGRERSFSPERSGYSQAAASQSAQTSSETIVVDSNSVGLIIGRGGESMRRIEQESGARVQFMQDQSQPRRQCRITGTKRQRADAIAEIFRVAQSNKDEPSAAPPRHAVSHHIPAPVPAPREGEKSTQIWVPDRTVGLIIGRGGETIRDLQEKSGCHVNITGTEKSENGMRPVNLIGTNSSAAHARRLIDEIVESDTRGAGPSQDVPHAYGTAPSAMQAPYDAYGAGGYDPYGSSAGPGSDGKITDTTIVPSEAVGMIIGKGGETIKDMQNTSSCKINVDQPSGADIDRRIELIGVPSAVEHAKRLIWEKVQTVRDKQGGSIRGGPQEPAPYDDPYARQSPYGQPPMPQHHAMPVHAASSPVPGDEYAAYGGYQNYMALWAAARPGGH